MAKGRKAIALWSPKDGYNPSNPTIQFAAKSMSGDWTNRNSRRKGGRPWNTVDDEGNVVRRSPDYYLQGDGCKPYTQAPYAGRYDEEPTSEARRVRTEIEAEALESRGKYTSPFHVSKVPPAPRSKGSRTSGSAQKRKTEAKREKAEALTGKGLRYDDWQAFAKMLDNPQYRDYSMLLSWCDPAYKGSVPLWAKDFVEEFKKDPLGTLKRLQAYRDQLEAEKAITQSKADALAPYKALD